MIKLLLRLKYRLPKNMKSIWWNRSIYTDKKYPIVNWELIGYLNCKVGLVVPMVDLGKGKYAYYKVVKIYPTSGGDWFNSSDKWNCDMIFETVRIGYAVGGIEIPSKPSYVHI